MHAEKQVRDTPSRMFRQPEFRLAESKSGQLFQLRDNRRNGVELGKQIKEIHSKYCINILQLRINDAIDYWNQNHLGQMPNPLTRQDVVNNGNAGLIRAWNHDLAHIIDPNYIFMTQTQWNDSRIRPQNIRDGRRLVHTGDFDSEWHLANLHQQNAIQVDPNLAIIGNDKDITGVLNGYAAGQTYPNCLSIYLHNNGISEWTQEANEAFWHH